jgi:hypothetical protein
LPACSTAPGIAEAGAETHTAADGLDAMRKVVAGEARDRSRK